MGIVLAALIVLSVAIGAQPQAPPHEVGVTGSVIAPDGTPASGGTALLSGSRTPLDRNGYFRLIPSAAGLSQLFINVPGFAPYRVKVSVPASRTMKLPPIQLSPATYFRARFVTTDGDLITSPQLRRQSFDVDGGPTFDPPDLRAADQIEDDGSITIGPLPRGITMLAVDMAGLARIRLPDLDVTGADTLLNGGTVVIQPGATLNVDVVDGNGSPVPRHELYLEDAVTPSPLIYLSARTNQQGRVTFERLGAGRYRLRTGTFERCNGLWGLSIGRLVAVSGNGALRTRMVIDGTATLRLSTPYGPMRGAAVTISPEATPSTAPRWLRARSGRWPQIGRPFTPFESQGSCRGSTDAEGRVTLTNFPPGPARIDVRLLNSTYVRRVNVPEDGKELSMVIPDGFLPLRVINTIKNGPIAGAAITWTDGAGRVEARATGNGEALLEGVSGAGTLAITADGFEPGEEKFPEPPGMLHEVALLPTPPTWLELQVVNTSGEPLRDAVVELTSANPLEVGHIAAADAKGMVMFADAPPGALRLVANADGYLSATMEITKDKRAGVLLKLSPRIE
jgi:hypothetical protein